MPKEPIIEREKHDQLAKHDRTTCETCWDSCLTTSESDSGYCMCPMCICQHVSGGPSDGDGRPCGRCISKSVDEMLDTMFDTITNEIREQSELQGVDYDITADELAFFAEAIEMNREPIMSTVKIMWEYNKYN